MLDDLRGERKRLRPAEVLVRAATAELLRNGSMGCGQADGRRNHLNDKATADIRSLARAQTALAIRTLTGICGSKAAPAAARVSAVSALLDRGRGRPQQTHTGEDGDIRVIIRTITEGAPPMPTCRVLRPAGSLGGGGVVGVGHGHPHHIRQIVDGHDKD